MTAMRFKLVSSPAALLLAGAILAPPARAEVVDEIVAKVNDDIVTKSDLESEEQGMLQDLYRRFSGPTLDAEVAKAKAELLRSLIDRKVLIQRAAHLFDMSKMQEYFLQSFMEQQNIKSEKDLEKMLAQEGMTVSEWKKKLVEVFAPQQVLRAEVAERIAISEKDARAYYDAHLDRFAVPAEATVREIVVKADAANREEKRARATAAREAAAAPGADFGAVAAEYSEAGTKSSGGVLGTVRKGDLAASLEAAAFSVPPGEVSAVIEADYGFHILKVDARTDAGVKPFDEVHESIETQLQNERLAQDSKQYLKKAWSEATIWISPKYQSRLSPLDAVN